MTYSWKAPKYLSGDVVRFTYWQGRAGKGRVLLDRTGTVVNVTTKYSETGEAQHWYAIIPVSCKQRQNVTEDMINGRP